MMSKISSVFFFLVVAVAFSVTEGTIRGTAQNDIADDPRRELGWCRYWFCGGGEFTRRELWSWGKSSWDKPKYGH
eukprot:CAMPEP_0170805688 /NCGR_PEP_ID=MMETSP0733-20121128/31532_1 /TAXON_ID=186038 /ORGANISM="Fragilariopsis kerguelensis, Strain L26-C5" /LENGTH=74 /DNA_ID=CAMNT_0011160143 /DNA_START=94 /DNA_END=318 /DNA_ORIENTATION=-